MSLYRSIMRDFDDDPFFRGPMETMRHMESMMESMMSPFGGLFGSMGMPQLEGSRGYESSRQNGNALMPFGFGRSLFPSVDDMFSSFNRLSQDPNCHSYSSSSVMTYTTDELGRPQVYQATSSRSTAPGGVSETRKSVQDTRTGIQRMAIGHHMKDKAHIVEKSRNRYTGEDEECQEFVNIEESEAEQFNREWQERVQPYRQRHPQYSLGGSRWRDRSPGAPIAREPLAITAGPASSPEISEPGSPQIEEVQEIRGHTVASKPKRKHGGGKSSRSGHRSHSRPHHETSM